jgi:hypothetical protein
MNESARLQTVQPSLERTKGGGGELGWGRGTVLVRVRVEVASALVIGEVFELPARFEFRAFPDLAAGRGA